jgi:hypothetical protein
MIEARYVHTNIVARDWRRLAYFYEAVFGCTPVPPARDLSGPELERATGIAGVRIRGVHLRLPGTGPCPRPGKKTHAPFTWASPSSPKVALFIPQTPPTEAG